MSDFVTPGFERNPKFAGTNPKFGTKKSQVRERNPKFTGPNLKFGTKKS